MPNYFCLFQKKVTRYKHIFCPLYIRTYILTQFLIYPIYKLIGIHINIYACMHAHKPTNKHINSEYRCVLMKYELFTKWRHLFPFKWFAGLLPHPKSFKESLICLSIPFKLDRCILLYESMLFYWDFRLLAVTICYYSLFN